MRMLPMKNMGHSKNSTLLIKLNTEKKMEKMKDMALNNSFIIRISLLLDKKTVRKKEK
jgi:hypothetical protein